MVRQARRAAAVAVTVKATAVRVAALRADMMPSTCEPHVKCTHVVGGGGGWGGGGRWVAPHDETHDQAIVCVLDSVKSCRKVGNACIAWRGRADNEARR